MAGPFEISPAAKGFGSLVGALTGRDKARKTAEANAWKQAEDMGKAKLLADEVLAREGLADALTGAQGPSDPVALAALLRSGLAGNYQQVTGGSQNLADMAIQSQALDLAKQESPDVAMLNRILATRAAGGGPLSPQEASVVPLGDALVQKERNQAALDAARAVTEGSRQGVLSAQAVAAQALEDSRRRPAFKIGKPGQEIYTGPSPLGGLAPPVAVPGGYTSPDLIKPDAALAADFIDSAGRDITPAELATIATGGTVKIPPRAKPKEKPKAPKSDIAVGTRDNKAARVKTYAPKTKADYDTLPKGARFIAPDGSVRIKP